MPALPTLRQLEYLCTLADLKSFSRAAERCHVTQSTFSAGIAALENLLGQTLIDRSRRQITLTPLGAELAKDSRDLLDRAAAITARARALSTPLAGPLRLGVIPTIAPYLLPTLIPALRRAYPKLELQVQEEISSRLVSAARNGENDVILMAFPFDTPGLETHMLFDEPFLLAAARGEMPVNARAQRETIADQNLLLLAEGHCLRDQALAACGVRPAGDPAFRATSLPTLLQMVRHGQGVTLLPAMAAKTVPAGITLHSFKFPVPGRTIGLAWRSGHPRSNEFRLLFQTLQSLNLQAGASPRIKAA